jgi:hypothetical protein
MRFGTVQETVSRMDCNAAGMLVVDESRRENRPFPASRVASVGARRTDTHPSRRLRINTLHLCHLSSSQINTVFLHFVFASYNVSDAMIGRL